MLLPLAVVALGGLSAAGAAPSFYWRGGDGNWSDVSRWAESLSGGLAYNPANFGVVSFNTTAANGGSQIITLNAERTIEGIEFSATGTTDIIGDINRTLRLYQSITVNGSSGAVTIGSDTENRKVSLALNNQANTWKNLSAHTLTVRNDVSIGDWSVLTVTGSGNTTVHGVISQGTGNDTLAKSGAGILTLSGANTYKGTTSVSAGTLVINGNQNAATGNLSVGSGATLAGTGTVGGNTVIAAGAVHSAGAPGAVGIQIFDRAGSATTSLTYDNGSIFSWNIDRTQTQTRGIGYDAVDVTGALGNTTGAVFQIVIGDSSFSDAFWNTARTWSDIFTDGTAAKSDWTGIFSGTLQYVNTAGVAVSTVGQGAFDLRGNTLTWTPMKSAAAGNIALPEPTSALAALLLGAGLLRRGRARALR